jgi:hypothetical protein
LFHILIVTGVLVIIFTLQIFASYNPVASA